MPPTEKQYVTLAREALVDFDLGTRSPWKEAMLATKGKPAGAVQRIERADPDGDDYVLVPFQGEPGQVLLVVRLDAETGDYLDSQATSASVSIFPPESTPQSLQAAILSTRWEPAIEAALRLIPPNAWPRKVPPLVWRPCLESFSPFRPFYDYPLASLHFYVRTDAKCYLRLSARRPGF